MMLRLNASACPVPSCFGAGIFHYFGLDAEKLKAAKEDALVMHPGP